jgi:hypothetical protein
VSSAAIRRIPGLLHVTGQEHPGIEFEAGVFQPVDTFWSNAYGL